jgi:glycine cleavage system H lipoate-binding protein
MSTTLKSSHNDIVLGLAKICAGAMFVYFFLKLLVFIQENNWTHLNTPWGYWFLVEIFVFVLIPLRLYTHAVKYKNIAVVKAASILTLVGILLNRLNTSVIAYNWQVAERYIPTWMEIEVTLTVVVVEILVLRWIVNRLPILSDPPVWTRAKEKDDIVNVGIDDFAQKLIGKPTKLYLPEKGNKVRQGENVIQVEIDGKFIEFLSPIDGKVVAINEKVLQSPEILNQDPYQQGWLIKVKSNRLGANLKNLLHGKVARAWIEETVNKLSRITSPLHV